MTKNHSLRNAIHRNTCQKIGNPENWVTNRTEFGYNRPRLLDIECGPKTIFNDVIQILFVPAEKFR